MLELIIFCRFAAWINLVAKSNDMKRLIPFIIFLLLASTSFAANYYRLESRLAPYVELTNDTNVLNITTSTVWGFEYMMQFSGTTLQLFNDSFLVDDTSIYVYFSTNGHVGVHTPDAFIIYDGLFTYLDSIDATSKVSYVVEGSGTNRILKIQWKNLHLREGQPGNFANVQMWYHLGSGIMECRYGESSVNNASGFTVSSGPYIGVFYSDKDFTQMYDKLWLNGYPAAYTIDSAQDFIFKGMHGVPTEGTLYRFVPKHITSVSNVNGSLQDIKLYPNPASGLLHVQLAGTNALQYLITDMSGKVMLKGDLKAKGNAINISKLSAGSYLFTSKDKKGQEHTQPLIVQ